MKKCVSRRRCYPKFNLLFLTLIEPIAIVEFPKNQNLFYQNY